MKRYILSIVLNSGNKSRYEIYSENDKFLNQRILICKDIYTSNKVFIITNQIAKIEIISVSKR